MTDRADFTFVAKEYHQRTPWIAAEQLAGDKLVLPGLIGFDLAPGTTFEQAKEIADYMRKQGLGSRHSLTLSRVEIDAGGLERSCRQSALIPLMETRLASTAAGFPYRSPVARSHREKPRPRWIDRGSQPKG